MRAHVLIIGLIIYVIGCILWIPMVGHLKDAEIFGFGFLLTIVGLLVAIYGALSKHEKG